MLQDEINSIIKLQEEVDKQEKEIQLASPELFAKIEAVNEAKSNIDSMWEALKQKLVAEEDFDVHEIQAGDYSCRFSVSRTTKVGVEDIEKVPEEFVEVKKVADDKKLKQYFDLYGKLPEGCVDKSYFRLNKKITKSEVVDVEC